eukprot:5211193-Heterocapsa_arctica.AAC.1
MAVWCHARWSHLIPFMFSLLPLPLPVAISGWMTPFLWFVAPLPVLPGLRLAQPCPVPGPFRLAVSPPAPGAD